MPEFIPRSLVVLAAVIAVIALFVGVRDYLASKHKPQPAVTTGAQSTAQPNARIARQKTTTAKRRRAELPVTEANMAVPNAAWNPAGKSLVKEVLMKVESTPDSRAIAKVQPVLNEVSSRSLLHPCEPLPNSTKPEDVDAIYYQGWAREYGCGLD